MHYGLDIGGTKIEIAIFNEKFERQTSQRVPTPTADYQAFLAAIKKLVDDADQALSCKGSIGIGLPGVIDTTTGFLISSNLPCAHGKPLRTDLENKLQRTVIIENDCRCFAYSESNGGAADDFSRVFGATLGTGTGGGFCIDKQMYTGARSLAGEWGHIPVAAVVQQKYQLPLWDCGCGLSGCVECYTAGPGLNRIYHFFGGELNNTRGIIVAMGQGDEIATKAFDAFIDITASAMTSLILTYDPDAIVLGGGLSGVKEIYHCLPQAMEGYLFNNLTPPAILPPKFGDSSGVRGAAILGQPPGMVYVGYKKS